MLLLSYLSLVDFSTLFFIMSSISLYICWLSRSTSYIVVVFAHFEVECSAIVFNYNESVDSEVSFGQKGMIGKWMKWLLGLLLFLYNKSLIAFVLFYDVPRRVCGEPPPPFPPNDSDVPQLERSRVCGEFPEHLLYWTVNILSVLIFITKAS